MVVATHRFDAAIWNHSPQKRYTLAVPKIHGYNVGLPLMLLVQLMLLGLNAYKTTLVLQFEALAC